MNRSIIDQWTHATHTLVAHTAKYKIQEDMTRMVDVAAAFGISIQKQEAKPAILSLSKLVSSHAISLVETCARVALPSPPPWPFRA